MDNYSLEQQSILKEIATICAGNASKALSELLNEQIEVMVPEVSFLPSENVPDFFGKGQEITTAISLKVVGDLEGRMILAFLQPDAKKLGEILTNQMPEQGEGLEQSALKEVANIICGSALNALSQFLGLNLVQSIPEMANDKLSLVAASLGELTTNVLIFRIKLVVENIKISGDLYFLFDLVITDKILQAVQQKGAV